MLAITISSVGTVNGTTTFVLSQEIDKSADPSDKFSIDIVKVSTLSLSFVDFTNTVAATFEASHASGVPQFSVSE